MPTITVVNKGPDLRTMCCLNLENGEMLYMTRKSLTLRLYMVLLPTVITILMFPPEVPPDVPPYGPHGQTSGDISSESSNNAVHNAHPGHTTDSIFDNKLGQSSVELSTPGHPAITIKDSARPKTSYSRRLTQGLCSHEPHFCMFSGGTQAYGRATKSSAFKTAQEPLKHFMLPDLIRILYQKMLCFT